MNASGSGTGLPGGRARSNALSGPSDPRWIPPSMIELKTELDRPLDMEASLTAFLKVLYGDASLMAAPGDLDWLIYERYQKSDGAKGGDASLPEMKKWVQDLWNGLAPWGGVRAKASLQQASPPCTLEKLFQTSGDLAALTDRVDFANRCSRFIYFQGVGSGKIESRLYANALFDGAPKVMALIAAYAQSKPSHGVVDMKVVGPALIRKRKDSIVVYCSSLDAAKALGQELGKSKQLLGAETPALTTPVVSGLGLSTGAEPAWIDTGLKSQPVPIKIGKGQVIQSYSPQSFGTIRAELIAMSVHSYLANAGTLGASFATFQKLVAVAFRGYGLDPANPGD